MAAGLRVGGEGRSGYLIAVWCFLEQVSMCRISAAGRPPGSGAHEAIPHLPRTSVLSPQGPGDAHPQHPLPRASYSTQHPRPKGSVVKFTFLFFSVVAAGQGRPAWEPQEAVLPIASQWQDEPRQEPRTCPCPPRAGSARCLDTQLTAQWDPASLPYKLQTAYDTRDFPWTPTPSPALRISTAGVRKPDVRPHSGLLPVWKLELGSTLRSHQTPP